MRIEQPAARTTPLGLALFRGLGILALTALVGFASNHITWIVAFVALVIWFAGYGLEIHWKNRSAGYHPILAPFQCYWEEILWQLPGGQERRIAYIKRRINDDPNPHGVLSGKKIDWHYPDIIRNNSYAKCADDLLPEKLHLILVTAIPLAVAYIIVALMK